MDTTSLECSECNERFEVPTLSPRQGTTGAKPPVILSSFPKETLVGETLLVGAPSKMLGDPGSVLGFPPTETDN